MTHKSSRVRRLPSSLLLGATQLAHSQRSSEPTSFEPEFVKQELGVRRINDMCIELESFDNNNRDVRASAIGVMSVFAMLMPFALWFMMTYEGSDGRPQPPLSGEDWLMVILIPWSGVVLAALGYFLTGAWRTRGAFIRLNRATRKLYYVAPGKTHLTVLDWESLVPMAGYVPIASQTSFTTRHPLYLIGVDDGQTPATQVCIACGNLGWRDEGESARQLWEYLQHFMARGSADLPLPPPVPPRGTRLQAFTRLFREWAAKFREDLPTVSSRLRSPLRVLGKVLWLVGMTFPDSLAEWIQYNVPYTPFPEEIDRLCGFSATGQHTWPKKTS
ncbi:hypothetical protein L5C66_29490 [Pseudomonas aeruginosa]|uniref:DUF6708 domain-containing protein n=1 Tax=Pseudomonas aeruginosa TaxID=287 RepID=UPI001F2FF00B|nr:DUF6708 domain-containing protein [Pseudomonas aeruginosa]MDG3714539.1 hypothetical protein [Pseudomonas aeruginosa]